MKSSSEISYDLNDRTNKAMQKCFSLQNIELNNTMDMPMQPPDLVRMNHHRIRKIKNDEDKIEKDLTFNSHGASSNDSTLNSIDELKNPNQQSFITEKLFNEFYVKTKQYSKSSSSLHQLLHFSVPQKMNIRELRKLNEEAENKEKSLEQRKIPSALLQLQIPPPPVDDLFDDSIEPSNDDDIDDDSIITDELPYCSVRDSIVHQERDEHIELQTPTENIYAEICQSNTTTPVASETTSEFSYKQLPITIATNNNATRITAINPSNQIKKMKNVSSIKISFDSESHTILSNGANE
jgi:hypothetical protein